MSAPTSMKNSSPPDCGSAQQLPIAGIIPFSATDWPDHLSLTVFTQGCPLRCVYCHNRSLQPFSPTHHTLDEAISLAVARRTLLDAVVISGGEPTAVAGLGAAIAAFHAHGFPVGLHTCGYAPARIATLLQQSDTTPDWVGLDIKALACDMESVIQRPASVGMRAWESLDLLLSAGVKVQTRTTCWRGSRVEKGLEELRSMLAAKGQQLVIQWARDENGQPFTGLPVSSPVRIKPHAPDPATVF